MFQSVDSGHLVATLPAMSARRNGQAQDIPELWIIASSFDQMCHIAE